MKKRKRSQATAKKEEMISAVLNDLKESSITQSKTNGESFLLAEGVTSNKSENTGSYDVPEGLLLDEKSKSTAEKYASTEEEPTAIIGENSDSMNSSAHLNLDSDLQNQFHLDSQSQSGSVLAAGPGPAVPPRMSEQDDEISDKTVVAVARPHQAVRADVVEPKVSYGSNSSTARASAFEAQFLQVENLKFAQQRIIELEKHLQKLRKENEVLSSTVEQTKQMIDDYVIKINLLEKQKNDQKESSESELQIFREGLNAKDVEIVRLRSKVEELENRLANDLRKIRVRERELENRLELARLEKTALLKSKDETILELKRRIDVLQGDLESYQNKVTELNQKIEANQAQFGRTVRALRIALTNLEVSEGVTGVPIKKAD